jgi:transcriptional regulator
MPSDFLPGTLDMLILKTVSLGPNHGYGIAQHIQQVSEDALRVGEGSLYPALQRLLVAGWLKAEWSTSETGRKVRAYHLTPAGRKQLAREAREFNALIAGIARVMEAM